MVPLLYHRKWKKSLNMKENFIKFVKENNFINGIIRRLKGKPAFDSACYRFMPLVMIIDSEGNNLYDKGGEAFLKQRK